MGRGYRYDSEPPTTDSVDAYNRGLQTSEATFHSTLLAHEEEKQRIKTANLALFTKLSKKQERELAQLSKDLAQSVHNFQVQQLEKLGEKYTEEELKSEKMQKKIAKRVEDFIFIEKQKNRAQEKTQEIRFQTDRKTAAMKADQEIADARRNAIEEEYKIRLKDIDTEKAKNKRALQDGKKSFKQYYKDRQKIIESENKLKQQTADKLRKDGASELDIMKQTGQITGEAVKEAVFSKETANTVANQLVNGLKSMFESTIQTYGSYQTKINTRLQGSFKTWNGDFFGTGIETKLKNLVGINPYVKLQSVMDNVVKATEAGIANNIEQRAFLETVKDGIATTFDAFNSNLLRLVRLQQFDTTGARLGLEAGITNFLNSAFKDSSYLNGAFDTVSQNIIEMTSQLSAKEGVAVEYAIQKWLGSLYSVGFSDSAVSKISQALGYLGSGNVNALSSDSEMQNLIVMAASRANMSYSDLLIKGLDASNTNKLLKSMVSYLAEIAESDNKVVKSQYAQIFGMTISDLKAVANLKDSISTISKAAMTYGSALNELYYQMGQLPSRTSVAGMMSNLYDNTNYSVATSIAQNPSTYALWQITSMIEDLTGGIPLPTFSVMGNMVDLNTTVTNLMRAGIVGVSTLGAIGSMINGVNSTVNPASMLKRLGIGSFDQFGALGQNLVNRGVGLSTRIKQTRQQSRSTMIGNTAGGDYYQQSLTSADEQTAKKMEQERAKSTDLSLNNIHEYLVSIFDPKITEIERAVVAFAGGTTSVASWGNFNAGSTIYKGSSVTVKYDDEASLKTSAINSIKESTSGIYELLKTVINNGNVRVSQTIDLTGISGGSIGAGL